MKATVSKTSPSFHRYLKPGALARLRDSRIISQSRKLGSHMPRFDPSRARNQTAPPQISGTDPIPRLLSGSARCGPHCLGRKRLIAHRSSFLQSLDSSGGSGDSLMAVSVNDAL